MQGATRGDIFLRQENCTLSGEEKSLSGITIYGANIFPGTIKNTAQLETLAAMKKFWSHSD